MTEQDRDIICANIIKRMCHGVDFGVGQQRIKVLAVNEDCTKALTKTPGHTGWSGIGSRSYYPGSVYLMGEFPERDSRGILQSTSRKELFEVTRETPLTKAKLKELMAEHGCNYTYEGMLELARP